MASELPYQGVLIIRDPNPVDKVSPFTPVFLKCKQEEVYGRASREGAYFDDGEIYSVLAHSWERLPTDFLGINEVANGLMKRLGDQKPAVRVVGVLKR